MTSKSDHILKLINSSNEFNTNTILSAVEKEYLTTMFNKDSVILDLQHMLHDLISDAKFDYHDIPHVILHVIKICCKYFKLYDKINILNIIKYITEIIVFTCLSPTVEEIAIINKIIDISISLLEINPDIIITKSHYIKEKIKNFFLSCCKRSTTDKTKSIYIPHSELQNTMCNLESSQEELLYKINKLKDKVQSTEFYEISTHSDQESVEKNLVNVQKQNPITLEDKSIQTEPIQIIPVNTGTDNINIDPLNDNPVSKGSSNINSVRYTEPKESINSKSSEFSDTRSNASYFSELPKINETNTNSVNISIKSLDENLSLKFPINIYFTN